LPFGLITVRRGTPSGIWQGKISGILGKENCRLCREVALFYCAFDQADQKQKYGSQTWPSRLFPDDYGSIDIAARIGPSAALAAGRFDPRPDHTPFILFGPFILAGDVRALINGDFSWPVLS
jgi:hypothetical protein